MRKKFLVKQKYLLILKIKNKMKNLQEMSLEEMRQTEGGIVFIAWGVMAACSVVALGMREYLKEKHPETVKF